jgi:hypothetical protein
MEPGNGWLGLLVAAGVGVVIRFAPGVVVLSTGTLTYNVRKLQPTAKATVTCLNQLRRGDLLD